MQELVTIGITTFNNYKYIKDAINSVFVQDYSDIELIITNDGGRDFDELELLDYIEKTKTDNIKNVIIKNSNQNVGTVKIAEYIRKKANGQFFMFLAADDALYDEHVISKFIQEFHNLGDEALIISAEVAMCSEDIQDIINIEPSGDAVDAILQFSSQQMFNRLSHTYTIPAGSTCYRKKIYDVVGGYDEDYFLIEDSPFFIRLARMGIKFNWINNFIAVRHRDGGISHGNKSGGASKLKKYRDDEVLFFEKEVIPFKHLIDKQNYKLSMDKYYFYKFRNYCDYLRDNMNIIQRGIYLFRYIPCTIKPKILIYIRKLFNNTRILINFIKDLLICIICIILLLRIL
nr:glycosyltransferase [uncultured Clostridium sp.]